MFDNCASRVEASVYWHSESTVSLCVSVSVSVCLSVCLSHSLSPERISSFEFLYFIDGQIYIYIVLLQTGFWPSYCHISTDLDKILHTHIAVRNTLVCLLLVTAESVTRHLADIGP